MHAIAPAIEQASYDPNGPPDQPDRYQVHSGCQSLLYALLQDVFLCLHSHSRQGKQQCERDRQWVLSDDTAPFSFIWTCQHLGVDPLALRRAYLAGVVFKLYRFTPRA